MYWRSWIHSIAHDTLLYNKYTLINYDQNIAPAKWHTKAKLESWYKIHFPKLRNK